MVTPEFQEFLLLLYRGIDRLTHSKRNNFIMSAMYHQHRAIQLTGVIRNRVPQPRYQAYG